MNKRQKIGLIGIIMLIAIGGLAYLSFEQKQSSVKEDAMSDAQKFATDYENVPEDNRFVYATSEEILELFESGTGLVFFGFPECPWCQKLAPLVNQAAKQENLDKIYYFNIREARSENDDTYQKIVGYLKDYLSKDEDGNPRVTVPDVTTLKNGEIVGRFKQESSGENEKTPDTFWTEERQERAVVQLSEMIQQIKQ